MSQGNVIPFKVLSKFSTDFLSRVRFRPQVLVTTEGGIGEEFRVETG